MTTEKGKGFGIPDIAAAMGHTGMEANLTDEQWRRAVRTLARSAASVGGSAEELREALEAIGYLTTPGRMP